MNTLTHANSADRKQTRPEYDYVGLYHSLVDDIKNIMRWKGEIRQDDKVIVSITDRNHVSPFALEKYRKYVFNENLADAEKGDTHAIYLVGQDYKYGWHGVCDKKRGWEYIQKAADLGHPFALVQIGTRHEANAKTWGSKETAFQCYCRAAAQSLPNAIYNEGRCYHYGIGVNKDLDRARERYKIANDARCDAARIALETFPS